MGFNNPYRGFVFGAIPIVGLAIGLAITATLVATGRFDRSPPGPQQVFEAHLLALDEGRLDDALSYVDTNSCGTDAVDDAPEALRDLKRLGYTYSTAFPVAEVWILEDGSRALLGIDPPENVPVPGVAHLRKVDGDWRVTCG